jgi:hypothetical protein
VNSLQLKEPIDVSTTKSAINMGAKYDLPTV